MLPIAYYLLKVIICSGILYGYYWLLLRNKVFHKYNRFYLMAAVMLSLLLPLIKINFWQQNAEQQSSVIKVLQVVSNGDDYMANVIVTARSNSFTAQQLSALGYIAVSLIFFLIFLHTLYSIFNLLKKYPRQTIDSISFINTDAKSTPFSFLNYIFWNYNIDRETTTGNQIFKHELAHVQEKHTHDKLFINIILIFFWCNPFFWLYRKELNMIHEFIADKKAVEDSDTEAFAAMILQATYPQHRFQLTNNFFYSPVRRRLMMLIKNKNSKVNYFGRIMVLPLALIIFAAFTFKTKAGLETNTSVYNGKKITVVIDAAGGGNNLRWKSATGVWEKDINLSIAQKIKLLNTNENIQIVLSRNSDVDVLSEYNNIAVSNNADLVITISMAQNVHNSNERGWDVCIPYDSAKNFKQSVLMGSILFENFSNNYGLPAYQNSLLKRAWVMTTDQCPSIMIQPGHITNQSDFSYFNNPDNQEKIAKNILAAINKFATANSGSDAVVYKTLLTPTKSNGMFINTKHSDTNYLKTDEFKTKALVIIDEKEMGYVGYNYIEKSTDSYSSVVIYNPTEARKLFGVKGKYGVIKLTLKDAIFITADSVFVDEKNNSVRVSGSKTKLKGNLENTIIYVDGKLSTPKELNAIAPEKISAVNILKGERLNDITDTKGKTSVIDITLKPVEVTGIRLTNTKPKPLYVIDGIAQPAGFDLNTIAPNDIQRIDVLRDEAAVVKYGEKGRQGVIEIVLKNKIALFKNPSFFIGSITGPSPTIDDFKRQNEIIVSDGYSFDAATVYFSGKGFPKVLIVNLNSSSLQPLKEDMESCEPGSVITFDNVRVKKDGVGLITIEGRSFSLRSNTIPDKVFTKVEVESAYPDGAEGWRKFLVKNINANIPVDEGWKAGTYTVIVQFIVHTDGSVSDVTATNYQGSKTAQHCIDLITKSGKWIPAVQNGHTVNTYRRQPITFVIEGADQKKAITELYGVPFKVNVFREAKVNATYQTAAQGRLYCKS